MTLSDRSNLINIIIDLMADIGRYLCNRFIMPNIPEIVFAIFYEIELQFINPFIVSPKTKTHPLKFGNG